MDYDGWTAPGVADRAHVIDESEAQRVIEMLPASNFFRMYFDYAHDIVACNKIYHIGVAAALVAAVAPVNLSLVGFKKATFANVFVLLVGASGKAEKTVGMDLGRSLLLDVNRELLAHDPTAEETLLKMLQTRPNRLFF